jgi:hypothetical protein
MGCCGGRSSSTRSIRKQVIERPQKATKQAVVQRIRKSATPSGGQQKRVIISRQHVVPRQKCHKCGFPTMVVNLAGRERLQCSNPDCRIIIK